MIRILYIFWGISVMLGLSSCHKTIHIHPWEEPTADEKAMLTLRIDNSAPRLGAVIDYTVFPAVIIYSDDLPENVAAHARHAASASDENPDTQKFLLQRAHSLAEAFDEIAPYVLDGDKWELHLKYEVYAGTAEQVKKGFVTPFHCDDIKYRADVSYPEHDVEVELPFGNVTVMAVAYIVPAGVEGDWFYKTGPLYNLICDIDKRQGEHDNVYRDCFVAGQEYRIEPTGIDGNVQHITATLTRPQGRYMVIADDYETYLNIAGAEITDAASHIYYPSYINTAYSVFDRMPIASSYDFGYDFNPSLAYADDFPYVRLGDDWSFVNGNRSNFNIDITVSDKKDDRVINHNPGILVPVFPDRVTLVIGHWLTKINEGGGGVFIDPDFTDEIVIHF